MTRMGMLSNRQRGRATQTVDAVVIRRARHLVIGDNHFDPVGTPCSLAVPWPCGESSPALTDEAASVRQAIVRSVVAILRFVLSFMSFTFRC